MTEANNSKIKDDYNVVLLIVYKLRFFGTMCNYIDNQVLELG